MIIPSHSNSWMKPPRAKKVRPRKEIRPTLSLFAAMQCLPHPTTRKLPPPVKEPEPVIEVIPVETEDRHMRKGAKNDD